MDGLILALKVFDERPLAGDTADSARVVSALPFRDIGDSGKMPGLLSVAGYKRCKT
jgi:hypothetical protein